MRDEVLFDNCEMFVDLNGVECYLIVPIKHAPGLIWKKRGDGDFVLKQLKYDDVTKELLIKHDVWSNFCDTVQCKIEANDKARKNQVHDKMADMRNKRRAKRGKYSDLPQELECSCGHKVKANWTVLNKKADKLGIPAIDLAKNYQCHKCNPTKGRRKKK